MKSITLLLVMLTGLIGLYGANYSVNFNISDLSTDINSRSFHELRLTNCSTTQEIGSPKITL